MKILNRLRDYLYSEDDTFNILKLYFFLPFIFIIVVHVWMLPESVERGKIIVQYFTLGIILVSISMFVYACFYHRKKLNFWIFLNEIK